MTTQGRFITARVKQPGVTICIGTRTESGVSAIEAGPKVIGGGRLAAALPPRRPHSLVRGATFLRRQLPTSRFCRLCRAQVLHPLLLKDSVPAAIRQFAAKLHPPHSAESSSFPCFSNSQVPAAIRKSAAKRGPCSDKKIHIRLTPRNPPRAAALI